MPQHHATGPAVWIGLASWLTVTFSAAWVGSWFQPGVWYASLVKPALTPPAWVFGPVWTLLYLMMGIAAWLVWRTQGLTGALGPLGLFLVQLALNALWSYLFFGLKHPGLALLDIVALWLAILATLVAFISSGGPPVAALSPLGEFCHLPQFPVLASQPLKHD